MRYMFLIYSRETELTEARALGGDGRNQEEGDLPWS